MANRGEKVEAVICFIFLGSKITADSDCSHKIKRLLGRSNQSILKEINPEYLLEGLMLKLKLQYFGHLMGRADSLEKTLMLGKIEGRRRGWQRTRWLDVITDAMNMNLSKFQEMVRARAAGHATVHGVMKSRTWLGNWTTTTMISRQRKWDVPCLLLMDQITV